MATERPMQPDDAGEGGPSEAIEAWHGVSASRPPAETSEASAEGEDRSRFAYQTLACHPSELEDLMRREAVDGWELVGTHVEEAEPDWLQLRLRKRLPEWFTAPPRRARRPARPEPSRAPSPSLMRREANLDSEADLRRREEELRLIAEARESYERRWQSMWAVLLAPSAIISILFAPGQAFMALVKLLYHVAVYPRLRRREERDERER